MLSQSIPYRIALIISVLSCFWLSIQFTWAGSEIDSLESLLFNARDTIRVNLLIQIGQKLINDHEQLQEYADLTIAQSEELDYPKGLGWGYCFQGRCSSAGGDYFSASRYYQNALELAREHGFTELQLDALHGLANVYLATGDNPNAQKTYMEALEFAQSRGLELEEAMLLRSLSNVYCDLKDFEKARSCLEQALNIPAVEQNPKNKAHLLMSVGLVDNKLGNTTSALDHYQRALLIQKELGDSAAIGPILLNMGVIYGKKGDYEKALSHFEAAELNPGSSRGRIIAVSNIAFAYELLELPEEAIFHYRRGLQLANEDENLEYTLQFCHELADLYKERGQPDSALRYAEMTIAAKDSQLDLYKKNSNLALNTALSDRQKDQRIESLENQLASTDQDLKSNRTFFALLLAGILLLGGLIVWLSTMLMQKQKADQRLIEQWHSDTKAWLQESEKEPVRTVPSTSGNKITLLKTEEILYFKADKRYVFAYDSSGNEHLIDIPLHILEHKLSPEFIRIYRSILVARTAIKSISRKDRSWYLILHHDSAQNQLPIGATYLEEVRSLMSLEQV